MTDISIDLFADFAAQCARELQAAGYAVPTGATQEVVRAYQTVFHRRVPQRPRTVHKAAYTIPAHLVAGEQAFISKIERGDSLRPHQSTRLERADFEDGMLNDFGIQHFHLGIGPHPQKPGFVERTDPLLFAMVRRDDFYCLGCYRHGEWSRAALLDLIHATWPRVIAGFSPKGVLSLSENHTDADIAKLRKAGINAATQRPDGTVHISPGGGVTTTGQGGAVSHIVMSIRRICRDLERELERCLSPKLDSGELSPPVLLRLEQRDSTAFVTIDGGRGEFSLGHQLYVFPL